MLIKHVVRTHVIIPLSDERLLRKKHFDWINNVSHYLIADMGHAWTRIQFGITSTEVRETLPVVDRNQRVTVAVNDKDWCINFSNFAASVEVVFDEHGPTAASMRPKHIPNGEVRRDKHHFVKRVMAHLPRQVSGDPGPDRAAKNNQVLHLEDSCCQHKVKNRVRVSHHLLLCADAFIKIQAIPGVLNCEYTVTDMFSDEMWLFYNAP